MRHPRFPLLSLATLVIAFAGSIGCADSDLQNAALDLDQQTDVQSAALAASVAGPSAATAESMINAMISLVQPSATRAPGDPTCPPTFDLGNGVTGTCMASGGTATFDFAGTLTIDSAAVTTEGVLVVTVSASQPATGASYSIDFNASASGPRGIMTWSASGAVTVDDAGNVVSFDFTMMLTVMPTGGSSTIVTVMIDANSLELFINGPLGGALIFQLDRMTMTGQLLLGPLVVANVMIIDGCTTVQFTVPGVPDKVVCSNG